MIIYIFIFIFHFNVPVLKIFHFLLYACTLDCMYFYVLCVCQCSQRQRRGSWSIGSWDTGYPMDAGTQTRFSPKVTNALKYLLVSLAPNTLF